MVKTKMIRAFQKKLIVVLLFVATILASFFAFSFLKKEKVCANADVNSDPIVLTVENTPFLQNGNPITELILTNGFSKPWIKLKTGYNFYHNDAFIDPVSSNVNIAKAFVKDNTQIEFNVRDGYKEYGKTYIDVTVYQAGNPLIYRMPVISLPAIIKDMKVRQIYVKNLYATSVYFSFQNTVGYSNCTVEREDLINGAFIHYVANDNYVFSIFAGGNDNSGNLHNFTIDGVQGESIKDKNANNAHSTYGYNSFSTRFWEKFSLQNQKGDADLTGYDRVLKEQVLSAKNNGMTAGYALSKLVPTIISDTYVYVLEAFEQVELTAQNSIFYPDTAQGLYPNRVNYTFTAVTGTAHFSTFWVCVKQSFGDFEFYKVHTSDSKIVEPVIKTDTGRGFPVVVLNGREPGTADVTIDIKKTINGEEHYYRYVLPVRMLASKNPTENKHITAYIQSAISTKIACAIFDSSTDSYELLNLQQGEYIDYYSNADGLVMDFFAGPTEKGYALKTFKNEEGDCYSICNGYDKEGKYNIKNTYFYTKSTETQRQLGEQSPYKKKELEELFVSAFHMGMHAGLAYAANKSYAAHIITVESIRVEPYVDISFSYDRNNVTYSGQPEFLQVGDTLNFSIKVELPADIQQTVFGNYKLVLKINTDNYVLLDYPSTNNSLSGEYKKSYTIKAEDKSFSSAIKIDYSYTLGFTSADDEVRKTLLEFDNIKVVKKPDCPLGYYNLNIDGNIGLNVYVQKGELNKGVYPQNTFEYIAHQLDTTLGVNKEYYLVFKPHEEYAPQNFMIMPISGAPEVSIVSTDGQPGTYYKFTLRLAPSDITQRYDIFVAVKSAENGVIAYSNITTKSVNDYIQNILETEDENGKLIYKNKQTVTTLAQKQNKATFAEAEDYYDKLAKMLASMLNYGNVAMEYEGKRPSGTLTEHQLTEHQKTLLDNDNNNFVTSLTSNPDLENVAPVKVETSGSVKITQMGLSLILGSNTTLRLYFSVSGEARISSTDVVIKHIVTSPTGTKFLITENKVAVLDESSGLYYVDVGSVEGMNINRNYEITFIYTPDSGTTQTYKITLSALNYIDKVLRATDSPDSLKKLAKALYWYYHYSSAYFA